MINQLEDPTFYIVLAITYWILALLYAWRIYIRKDRPFSQPGMKIQMMGLIIGGIGFWLRSVEISHSNTRPGMDAVFMLAGFVLMFIGGISFMRQRSQNRNRRHVNTPKHHP